MAIISFVIALIAAVFGFGGVVGEAAGVAKGVFLAFLILGALSLMFRRRVVRID